MILSPEAIALLKRQDADDALQSAALVGWNKAIAEAAMECERMARVLDLHGASRCAAAIRSLAKQENTK